MALATTAPTSASYHGAAGSGHLTRAHGTCVHLDCVAFWNRKKAPEVERDPLPLEERLSSVERKIRALDEDLDDLHDRFKRFQGRTLKRAALDATDATPDSSPGAPDPASTRILSLRHRAKVRPGGAM